MTREDIIRMAREAGIEHLPDNWGDGWWQADSTQSLERFAELVAAAERKTMVQLFTDPENQPSQYGTVTLEYMQREIEAKLKEKNT